MNFALAHVLGATLQTALFNSSLAVIVGWGLDKSLVRSPFGLDCGIDLLTLSKDLNFPLFQAFLLILAILCVGNFLKDGESNYLEGSLCVLIYLIIAISTYYVPNPPGLDAAIGDTGGNAS